MRLTPNEIERLIWPEFLWWYAEGGDNVAELAIAKCERSKASAVVESILASGGWVLSASDYGDKVEVPRLTSVIQALRPDNSPAEAVLLWEGSHYWLFASAVDQVEEINFEITYRGPQPLLELGTPEAMQLHRFLRFVALGLCVYDAGHGQALAINDDSILWDGWNGAFNADTMVVAHRFD